MPENEMNRIGVWGDSIAWGAFDLQFGGWVSRLRHYIDNNIDDGPSVYNVGISGDKVGDVLKRFDAEYEARLPETVIFAIGINDSPHDSHPRGTPLGGFEQAFNGLVSKAKSRAEKVIVVSPTNIDDGLDSSYKNASIEPYKEVIKKVATTNKLPYVDVFGSIAQSDLKLDGLHPLAGGHQEIFQAVKLALGYK